jgi:CHAD domain-containing protein
VTHLHKPHKHRVGLGYWMRRVLKECRRAGQGFAADPVHDLRVALRRCRSLAGGLMQIDPQGEWRVMRRAGRGLFRRLGRLRDIHVMAEWVTKLAPAGDPVRERLLPLLAAEELQLKHEARQALEEFDRVQWAKWAETLPHRANRVEPDSPVFQHFALERWHAGYDLHRRALHVRSRVAFHQLRIGLKRFRYTVENFLPSGGDWLRDLKHLQDQLGEVHDLDVLRARFFTRRKMFTEHEKAAWRERIEQERATRLADYRQRMIGRASLWRVWRAALPSGPRLEEAGLAKLEAWASFLDPHFRHSQEVARIARSLHEGFASISADGLPHDARARKILVAAGLVHDVGRAEGSRGHHKATYKLITRFPPPLGWTTQEMRRVALVARYHRGAEPRATHQGFRSLSAAARRRVLWLAGLLRLADGIVKGSRGPVTQVRVEERPEAILVWARGFVEDRRGAALLGDRKHLLEVTLGRPVIVQGWRARSLARPPQTRPRPKRTSRKKK